METLLSHCSGLFSQGGGVYPALFMGGLTGGLTHCLLMCGPFIACEGLCASRACTASRRLAEATGVSYHFGRLLTYGGLGFGAAMLSRQLAASEGWPVVSAGMLGAAGLLFLLSCLKACRHPHALPRRGGVTFLRGALLGFLPCGLLYAALMMAATLADPWGAMLGMWLFVLGTMPALILAAGGAEWLGQRWRMVMLRCGRVMLAFNGLSLLVMAAQIMRTYA